MLEVVTVWAPRRSDPRWREGYLDLMRLQRKSCERAGHRHRVVTDSPDLRGYDIVQVSLPDNLMKALTTAQLFYVRDHWDGKNPLVLVDLDCLVCRDLTPVFDGHWDIGLTSRDNPLQPIQNGAMYFAAGAQAHAVGLFERTLETCGDWWGADQVALAKAVAPVPRDPKIDVRHGARIHFMNTKFYNHTLKHGRMVLKRRTYIEHFKGEQKRHAPDFAAQCLGIQ